MTIFVDFIICNNTFIIIIIFIIIYSYYYLYIFVICRNIFFLRTESNVYLFKYVFHE